MPRISSVLAAALCLGLASQVLASPVSADPSPQLVSLVQMNLPRYGISVDVSQFATSTVAALHMTMANRDSYYDKQRRLRAILRNAKYK
jgi:hypothetical protein